MKTAEEKELAKLYAEFSDEDKQLAELGTLRNSECGRQSAASSRLHSGFQIPCEIDPRYHRMLFDNFEWRQKFDYRWENSLECGRQSAFTRSEAGLRLRSRYQILKY